MVNALFVIGSLTELSQCPAYVFFRSFFRGEEAEAEGGGGGVFKVAIRDNKLIGMGVATAGTILRSKSLRISRDFESRDHSPVPVLLVKLRYPHRLYGSG